MTLRLWTEALTLGDGPVGRAHRHPGRPALMGAEVWAQALIDFCRGRIANDKVPREVHFNDPGPWLMSLTRINKRQLRVRRAGPS